MSVTIQTDKKAPIATPKGQWLFPITQLTEVNRLGLVRYPAVKAAGTLTLNSNPSNNETATVNGKVYTFVNTLTGVDGQVKILATKELTAAAFAAAINLSGTPNAQYASATTLHPDVSARVSGAVVTVIARVGGTAGNSITTTETFSDAASIWNGATLGTTTAGAAESDADSILHPSYQGAVSNNSAQNYNIREMFYHGAGEIDGSDDRMWSNKDVTMNFPMQEYKLLAGASRKYFTPNHQDIRVKRLESMNVKSHVQRPTWQQLASPFAESTNNITFHTVEMGDDRFALFYRQQAGTTGIYVVIGQMQNDGTVTWGTPVLVTAKDQYDLNFDAILVNTDKILCAFGNGASDFMHTATLTVSGTVVSLNTPVQVAAVAYTWKRLTKLNTDKALLAYFTGTTLSIVVVTVTGTVPSYGGIVTQATSSQPVITQNGTDKVQLIYTDTAAARLRSSVITVVGTTPTIQASILIGYDTNMAYKVNSHNLIQVATDKFIYYHPWGQLHPFRARDRSKFIMLTVSGNVTSIAHTLQMPNTIIDTNITYIKLLSGTDFAYYNIGQRRAGKISVNTSTNRMTVSDIPFRMSHWDDSTNQPINVYLPNETASIQRVADPAITTKGWAFCTTNNELSGAVYMWTDKTFSFELYENEILIGTFTKSMPSVIEGIAVRVPINKLEFNLRIKNTGTVDLNMFWIHKIITALA
jgi:hypothetical protein